MFRSMLSFLKYILLLPHAILRQFWPANTDEHRKFDDNDHPLLQDHTEYRKYSTSYATYPALQTFYHAHAHTDKLKAIADLPLLVFIHGLGGSLPQFAPLLGSFVNIAPVFAIELPGHGTSEFAPTTYEAYTFEALVELWKIAIQDVCLRYGHRKVVLICHSLGCSIGASLASPEMDLDVEVMGIIAICPKASPPTRSQVKTYQRLLFLPDFALDILRFFDRLGDASSKSVHRFVGETADINLKRLQLRFNKQFRTPVWKRTSLGLLPRYDKHDAPHGGLVGRSTWERITVPLFLIAGETDTVTKPSEATDIVAFVQGKAASSHHRDAPLPVADENGEHHDSALASDTQHGVHPTNIKTTSGKNTPVVKLVILPSPASHALMYDHSTYRTTAGLIEDFLSHYISPSLELGWQLQQLTTSGKWDVKNLEKWKKVLPVSDPIDDGFFRALKTLREQDEEHTPSVFIEKWKGQIYALIDISHDSPIYDTKALERGGIQYHKFPTVSKIPPTFVEVHDFIALVDRLRSEIEERYAEAERKPAIGVHCHYGYNRTGFFIVCYLVERRGYTVQDAIDEFARHKPPGIRHDHFIDTLFVRYCVGLRRGSTFK